MSGTPAESTIDAADRVMMERCLALAMRSVDLGEYPYAAVICRNGEVVCEFINSVRHDRDVTRHAEMVAMSEAQHRLNRVSFEDCTIYANAEPCALCCYAMRETRIGRVVFGVPAPLTGGVTRWNILADTKLSNVLPEVFAPPPEIVPGFMREEIEFSDRAPRSAGLGVHSRTQHFWRAGAGADPHARNGTRPPRHSAACDVVPAPLAVRLFRSVTRRPSARRRCNTGRPL